MRIDPNLLTPLERVFGIHTHHVNPHIGREHRELSRDLLNVAVETRKRLFNNNDTEDQDARAQALRDARASLN